MVLFVVQSIHNQEFNGFPFKFRRPYIDCIARAILYRHSACSISRFYFSLVSYLTECRSVTVLTFTSLKSLTSFFRANVSFLRLKNLFHKSVTANDEQFKSVRPVLGIPADPPHRKSSSSFSRQSQAFDFFNRLNV